MPSQNQNTAAAGSAQEHPRQFTSEASEPRGDHASTAPSPVDNVTDEEDSGLEPGPRHLGLAVDDFLHDAGAMEGPWEYMPGGHHPLVIGHRIGADREYKVIQKLGSGGSGNVWLCEYIDSEPQLWVAVKILKACISAEESRELKSGGLMASLVKTDPVLKSCCSYPWEVFGIQGVNGLHLCFVYPVRGAPVSELRGHFDDPDAFMRKLTRQAARVMGTLHGHDIVHGDFRPLNVLLQLGGLNGKTREEIVDIFGHPAGAKVIKYPDAHPAANPPEYLYYPVNPHAADDLRTHTICVIDFGESFIEGNPPPHGSGIPCPYAAPEVPLDSFASKRSDIWALAATMYEIRCGHKLFLFEGDGKEAYLHGLVRGCGKLPAKWWPQWRETWNESVKRWHPRIFGGPESEDQIEDEQIARRRHIQQAVARPVGHMLTSDASVRRHEESDVWISMGHHEPLSSEEQELFADLLYRMTEMDPQKRMTIEEVLEHPWLSYGHTEQPQQRLEERPSTPEESDLEDLEDLEERSWTSEESDQDDQEDREQYQPDATLGTKTEGSSTTDKCNGGSGISLRIPKAGKPTAAATSPCPTRQDKPIYLSTALSPVSEANEPHDSAADDDIPSVKAVSPSTQLQTEALAPTDLVDVPLAGNGLPRVKSWRNHRRSKMVAVFQALSQAFRAAFA
ncbi:uncharacterized protein DSM5745_09272 [Aspergillus mulundensis]|uniref:EKC/KEOPS complex subunit BUD32 n=1 Tax=Aspergillus mulundensis TaxID=1810919 RepID=A0A3D8R035_9EURO|nr:hypothetical protein DSM5745_09272 [Aspergillus mulundensis]RDW67406.1 hypothetical protein DSM5745_09272 [Aspergillus mulundensis]